MSRYVEKYDNGQIKVGMEQFIK
ncbi:uncharacterized protein METZ01_LOCUS405346 [marine metagenome]|uniref:Uncharacterized protein n=1 Tax=marine metagenome TaxID=408172 RepID=A0A382W112_9ZZZZ